MSMFRNLLMASGKKPRLPSEYQEVEYIQTSGSQRINTGYRHKSNTIYDINFQIVRYNARYNTILGGRKTWNSSDAYAFGFENSYYFYTNSGQANATLIYQGTTGVDYHVIVRKDDIYINDQQYIYTNYNQGDGTPTRPSNLSDGLYDVYLFALNQKNSAIEPCRIKLYSLKVYEGDTLKMEFVPCYRKSDSVIGLYDLVANTFFTNAGSGTFTAGPEV